MNTHLRRLSLLIAVIVACVAICGAAFGHWTETLTIEGVGCVSEVPCFEWVEQEVNDSPGHTYVPGIPGADESVADGFSSAPFRLNKDVGWNECFLLDTDDDGLRDTIEFIVHNAYPSYFGKVIGTIYNCGPFWVQIDAAHISYPQYPGASPDEPGPYDWSSPPVMSAPWPHPPEFEVKWANGGHNLPIIIPPGETTFISAMVHILQPAAQDAQYLFRVALDVSVMIP
jgi:hypothetical protein